MISETSERITITLNKNELFKLLKYEEQEHNSGNWIPKSKLIKEIVLKALEVYEK